MGFFINLVKNIILFSFIFFDTFSRLREEKKSDRNANQIITWCLKRNFANCEINIHNTQHHASHFCLFLKKTFFLEIKCFLKRWSAKGREIQITSLHSELKMVVRKCCKRQVIKLHFFILLSEVGHICWRGASKILL